MISDHSIGLLLVGLRILAVISLYVFLGGALFTLWQDLIKYKPSTQQPSFSEIKLEFTKNIPYGEFTYQQPKITLGRALNCDCILDNSTVSTQHARLSFHHSQWWIEDLNSKNGTFLNQTRIEVPTVVIDGDEIRCGEVEFIFNKKQ